MPDIVYIREGFDPYIRKASDPASQIDCKSTMDTFRTIILPLCCSLLPFLVHSQQKGRLALGPKVGYNLSRINLEDCDAVSGVTAGVSADFWLNRYSVLTLDFLYSEEGYEVPTAVIDYTYLQIPMMYQVVFGRSQDLLQPKLSLGFSPGFLLKARINGSDFTDQNRNEVFNVVGGAGAVINITQRIWFHADVRAYLGLSGIEINHSGPEPYKNRTLQASLGLIYGL
jgi:hypothetical protein